MAFKKPKKSTAKVTGGKTGKGVKPKKAKYRGGFGGGPVKKRGESDVDASKRLSEGAAKGRCF